VIASRKTLLDLLASTSHRHLLNGLPLVLSVSQAEKERHHLSKADDIRIVRMVRHAVWLETTSATRETQVGLLSLSAYHIAADIARTVQGNGCHEGTRALQRALLLADRNFKVGELAKQYRMAERSLRASFRRVHLGRPRDYIRWSRLLHFALLTSNYHLDDARAATLLGSAKGHSYTKLACRLGVSSKRVSLYAATLAATVALVSSSNCTGTPLPSVRDGVEK
jgi:AraC-like DNA-binding protein